MPAGTGEHRQLQLFTIFYIKKQSVHYRILRSYKDTLHGRSAGTRTPGLLLPNLSGILFLLVYSAFLHLLIHFTYSLTLLSPLFPGVPAPYVVIYVVKNASRPVSGEDSPVPDGKRFSLLCGLYCNSGEGIMQVVSAGWRLRSCGAIDKE